MHLSKLTQFILLALFLGTQVLCSQNSESRAKESDQALTDASRFEATLDTAILDLDGLVVSSDHFKLLLENDYVRVTEYSLKPGEKDPAHTHLPKSGYLASGGTFKIYPENR